MADQRTGRPPAGTLLHRLAERTEELRALDGLADPLAQSADGVIRRAHLKALLSGTWLGHPLHPLATDAVIGAWAMAAVLDFGRDDRFGPAADRLVGLGVVAALPTAAAGTSDWADVTAGRVRRMGLVHAAGNAAALALNASSYAARKAGRRRLGKRLTLLSGAPLAVSGFLGAHLSYVRGVGVSHTAFDEQVPDWTPATEVGGAPPLAHDGHAVGGTCTHCGARLEPEPEGGAVRCPADGSRFSATDGTVLEGPATTPLPRYEARTDADGLKVRSPA